MKKFSFFLFFILPAGASSAADEPRFVTPEFTAVGRQGEVKFFGRAYPLHAELEKDRNKTERSFLRYRVPLGKLSSSAFAAFATQLASAPPGGYLGSRSYELADFLPPFAQAVEGKQFFSKSSPHPAITTWLKRSHDEEIDQSSEELHFATNCWQTALELLRGRTDGFDAYYPPEASIAALFLDQKKFRRIQAKDLKPGDLLFLYIHDERGGDDVGRHAAFYVGGGLWFEKTGSDQEHLYRLVPGKEIDRDYPARNHKRVYLRKTAGSELPGPRDFSVAITDPKLAAEIDDPITSEVSVETAFAQGILSFNFTGVKPFRLRQGTDRWEVAAP